MVGKAHYRFLGLALPTCGGVFGSGSRDCQKKEGGENLGLELPNPAQNHVRTSNPYNNQVHKQTDRSAGMEVGER